MKRKGKKRKKQEKERGCEAIRKNERGEKKWKYLEREKRDIEKGMKKGEERKLKQQWGKEKLKCEKREKQIERKKK